MSVFFVLHKTTHFETDLDRVPSRLIQNGRFRSGDGLHQTEGSILIKNVTILQTFSPFLIKYCVPVYTISSKS